MYRYSMLLYLQYIIEDNFTNRVGISGYSIYNIKPTHIHTSFSSIWLNVVRSIPAVVKGNQLVIIFIGYPL